MTNKLYRFSLSLLLLTGISVLCVSQNISITQYNESGIYKKGEVIIITTSVEKVESDSVTVYNRKNFSTDTKDWKVKLQEGQIEVFNGTFSKPTSMIVEVKTDSVSVRTGLVVAPEEFVPGTNRPKDFDKYWKQEKKSLCALPMNIKSIPVKNIENGFECADVEINCTGPKPARGYFAKPKSAKPKSLPIVLFVHAAGVKGSWCLAQPETAIKLCKKRKGCLAFDLNAHGMLNGQAQEYYDNLEEGELKGYYYQGIESREDFYFRGMYLRLLRTIEFLCSQPEWDGKRLIVIGESQGGGQALAAAGLDKRVSAAVATVPAMCDWGGPSAGKNAGWPQPFSQPGNQQENA